MPQLRAALKAAQADEGEREQRFVSLQAELQSSKEELERRLTAATKSLDAGEFRHARRERLAAELIRAWDAAQTEHCGEFLVPGSEASERHRLCCVFRPMACANDGCVATFSARL